MDTYCDGCDTKTTNLTQVEKDPQAVACYLCPTCLVEEPCHNHVEQPGVNCPSCGF